MNPTLRAKRVWGGEGSELEMGTVRRFRADGRQSYIENILEKGAAIQLTDSSGNSWLAQSGAGVLRLAGYR